ncbi:MAG: TonB-dependent receptor [Pseudomonadales bacterium]
MKRTINQVSMPGRHSALALAIACTAVALPTTTLAQSMLEEVLVTATKRASSIQDIPMSIQALSGDMLEAQGISDLADLSAYVPNLNIGDGLSNTFVNVRGMGNGNDSIFEQPVSLFVDEIYMPRSESYSTALLDVDRIEVLRGSQAVLFGLNSTAGAVSIHSRKNRPGDEFEGKLKASYESEYEAWAVEASIGGSLSENFAARLALKTSRGDNYYENTNTGESVGDAEFDAVRLSAVWEPADNWSVEGKVEWAERSRSGNNAALFTTPNDWRPQNPSENNAPGNYATIHADAVVQGNRRLTYTDDEFGFFEEQFNLNVKIENEWQNGHTLTAVLGYGEIDSVRDSDLLFSVTPDWTGYAAKEFEQLSAEVRIASPADQTVSYIAGIYYQDTDLLNGGDNFFDLAAFGVPIGNILVHVDYDQTTDLISPFATFNWDISDSVSMSLGARYVSEDKDYDRRAFNETDTGGIINGFVGGAMVDTDTTPYDRTFATWVGGPDLLAAVIGFAARSDGFVDSRSSDNFMAEAHVQWDMSDDNMAYFKIGNSAKSGGWSSAVQATPDRLPFDDEKALSYEVGMKSSLLDGAAQTNIAVFFTEYEDLQVNSFDNNGDPSVTNASGAESYGIELDGRWAVNEWLRLSGAIAYLNAEFVDFPVGPGTADGITRPAGSDYSGLPTPHAPDFSGNLRADIEVPLSDGLNMIGGLAISYKDDYFTEGSIDPAGMQDAWTKVDALIGVQSADAKWRVAVRGKNLTDEHTSNAYQFFVGNSLAFLAPPRTITLEAEYRFGK